jgi:hypothetical protein
LYDNANDLDPQPIFPLRTELKFYRQEGRDPVSRIAQELTDQQQPAVQPIEATNTPPAATIFTLWIFGLMVWCVAFITRGESGPPARRSKGSSSGVKDV